MFTPPNSATDLRWLDDAACADLEISDFFVDAGHVISEEVLEICRTCPVRKECVEHAFERGIVGGYFGGISPGQRRDMKRLDDAYSYIDSDPPSPRPGDLEGEGGDAAAGVDPIVIVRLRGVLAKAARATSDDERTETHAKAVEYARRNNVDLEALQAAGVV